MAVDDVVEVQEPPKKRVQCFIDGYNLYHAIDETRETKNHWVDLWKLASRYISGNTCVLSDVFWFSAPPVHLPKRKQEIHANYSAALQHCGVSVVSGKFKLKKVSCNAGSGCGKSFDRHEEKESDVNLAIGLVSAACNDEFDIAIVITADSDLCPPIKYVRNKFPDKQVWILIPPKRRSRANDLKAIANREFEITNKDLRASCLLQFYRNNTGVVAQRPPEWS